MAQGHFRREWLGLGTASSGDTISTTLPLTSGWEIKEGSLFVYRERTTRPAYLAPGSAASPQDIMDDSGGRIGDVVTLVASGSYTNMTGSYNVTTGAITVNENADNPFDGSSYGCWVEYYEYNPSVADDYDGVWSCGSVTDYPLILTEYPHASFGSNNLTQHGTNCLLIRQQASGDRGALVLWKKGLSTSQAVMCQCAFRPYQVEDFSLGPSFLQRAEDISSLTRWGYQSGIKGYAAGNVLFDLYAGGGTLDTQQRVAETAGANAYSNSNWYNSAYNSVRKYVDQDHATYPIAVDDWHLLRMITTVEADDDVHVHMLIARGATQVDAVSPTFDTLFDVWHVSGLAAPQNYTSGVIPDAQAALISTFTSTTPQALQPIPGRAGLIIGGIAGRADSRVAFDSVAIHPMPGP